MPSFVCPFKSASPFSSLLILCPFSPDSLLQEEPLSYSKWQFLQFLERKTFQPSWYLRGPSKAPAEAQGFEVTVSDRSILRVAGSFCLFAMPCRVLPTHPDRSQLSW